MKNLIVRFVREDAGQDLIEYSLLAAIIAVGSIVAMGLVGDEIDNTFDDIVTGLQTRELLSGAIGSARSSHRAGSVCKKSSHP